MASKTEAPAASASSSDETPYPAISHPQTHPNRLAAMARLFGIPAAAPSKSRVLELGCADGSNLLPMADQYRDSTFLGVDVSKSQIAEGHKAIAASGLKNIELRQQDIMAFPASEGKFDYIIVNGLFSFVTVPVREKILAICNAHLAENGIAYISYNALPGWNLRRSLRDMMLYHTVAFPDAKMKVQQARALLSFLAESVPTENNAYGMLLKSELEFMRGQPDSFLLHDILQENNTPYYFHAFMTLASQHGLQYLSETGITEMLASNFPEKVRETLAQVSGQIVRQEQYMDFLRNRAYRQTLLCRTGLEPKRNITPELVRSFAFRSLFKQPEGAIDLSPGVNVSFTATNGISLTTGDSFVKAILQSLAESAGASAISYRELLDISRVRSRPVMGDVPPHRDQIDDDTLSLNVLTLLAKGFIELYAEPVSVNARLPEKPAASPLVRYQAANARFITNRVHQPLPADVLARYIVELCDGKRTRDEILSGVVTYVKQDKLSIKEGEQRITDVPRLKEILGPRVDMILNRMAGVGFFNT